MVLVDNLCQAVEYLVEGAKTINLCVLVLRCVVVRYDGSLLAVDLDAVADNILRGVVSTARVLATKQDALDELLFGNIHIDHNIDLRVHLLEQGVEDLGLSCGAGEAIEDTALVRVDFFIIV